MLESPPFPETVRCGFRVEEFLQLGFEHAAWDDDIRFFACPPLVKQPGNSSWLHGDARKLDTFQLQAQGVLDQAGEQVIPHSPPIDDPTLFGQPVSESPFWK